MHADRQGREIVGLRFTAAQVREVTLVVVAERARVVGIVRAKRAQPRTHRALWNFDASDTSAQRGSASDADDSDNRWCAPAAEVKGPGSGAISLHG